MSGAALTHGYNVAFWVLAGTAAAGAVLVALLLESRPVAEPQPAVGHAALKRIETGMPGGSCIYPKRKPRPRDRHQIKQNTSVDTL